MKRLFAFAALSASAWLCAMPAQAGVSITIGQPGFYGQLSLGGFPPPQLIYPQPVVIQPAPVAVTPMYLRVPPGHMKDWRRYCGRYGACGRPVYFVRDEWYRQVYVPRYQQVQRGHEYRREHERHGWHGDDDHDHGRGHERDRRDWRRDR
ncbi:hypothetical protein [Chromobacterium rhizoryzae]|uniref:hypothetical protein n=1 Tax=Chromobacterium rhizoryzae TaxID=1778675 RepID=UPI001D080615|nr:hypothetical protein [Chromobacterium rhizoryzae]